MKKNIKYCLCFVVILFLISCDQNQINQRRITKIEKKEVSIYEPKVEDSFVANSTKKEKIILSTTTANQNIIRKNKFDFEDWLKNNEEKEQKKKLDGKLVDINPDEWRSLSTDNEKLKWANKIFYIDGGSIYTLEVLENLTNSLDSIIVEGALRLLAILKLRQKDYIEAENLYNRGVTRILDGKDLENDWNKLSNLEKSHIMCNWKQKSVLYFQKKDFNKELLLRKQIVKYSSQPPSSDFALLAFAYLRNNDRKEAMSKMEKAIKTCKSKINDEDSPYTIKWYGKYLNNWKKGGDDNVGSSL